MLLNAKKRLRRFSNLEYLIPQATKTHLTSMTSLKLRTKFFNSLGYKKYPIIQCIDRKPAKYTKKSFFLALIQKKSANSAQIINYTNPINYYLIRINNLYTKLCTHIHPLVVRTSVCNNTTQSIKIRYLIQSRIIEF